MSKTLVESAEKYISNPELPKEIYQDDGLRIHVQRRHPECEQCLSCISDIISNPDYIGRSPRESDDSFELVKIFDNNVQIGIKLDSNSEYRYVSTLYTITDAKLAHRIQSNRLRTLVP
jgi:hypothetical protein